MAERIPDLNEWVSKAGQWLENNHEDYRIVLLSICILLSLILAYLSFRRLKRKRTLRAGEDFEKGDIIERQLESRPDQDATESLVELEAPEPSEKIEVITDYEAGEKKEPFFVKLKNRMAKTHDHIIGQVEQILSGSEELDDDSIERLEEVLITADMGVKTVTKLIERVNNNIGRPERCKIEAVKEVLKEEILEILSQFYEGLPASKEGPHVTMVLGVNGAGKTTTIGKIANSYRNSGQRVLLAAADTFRAAAREQLEIWGERVDAEVISQREGADPSAVVFDALHAAKARSVDRVIIDTAGRLHTKINLMEELKKIKRVIAREVEDAPHEVLLVLDATTGQNAVLQARMFHKEIGVSGIVLTKLDGTAKGGVIVSIASEMRIPIKYIGIGEGMDDLQPFRADEFVDAIFS